MLSSTGTPTARCWFDDIGGCIRSFQCKFYSPPALFAVCHLVLTASGSNRPGIISRLSERVLKLGGRRKKAI
jgi:hypothetical protein